MCSKACFAVGGQLIDGNMKLNFLQTRRKFLHSNFKLKSENISNFTQKLLQKLNSIVKDKVFCVARNAAAFRSITEVALSASLVMEDALW